ncbi:MAG: cell division protein ZapA [Bacteroidota bacterium]
MNEKLTIRVNIADRHYPLNIDLKDEEKIRKAAKKINDTILQYKQKYSDKEKDNQDFLAMASLQFITKNIDLEQNQNVSRIISGIEQLNAELDEYLSQKR